MLAVPISLGLTLVEVSERTGLSPERISQRMRDLRREIRAQLGVGN
jgi:DNA-binding Lrp family transcriptional regulator